MVDAFLYFVLGAATMRFLQILLAITPNFYIFKQTEYTSLYILAELHVHRITALKILELSYNESGKPEEFFQVKRALDEKYNTLINKCMANLKYRLPYKVEYNTLEEAAAYYRKSKEENKDG